MRGLTLLWWSWTVLQESSPATAVNKHKHINVLEWWACWMCVCLCVCYLCVAGEAGPYYTRQQFAVYGGGWDNLSWRHGGDALQGLFLGILVLHSNTQVTTFRISAIITMNECAPHSGPTQCKPQLEQASFFLRSLNHLQLQQNLSISGRVCWCLNPLFCLELAVVWAWWSGFRPGEGGKL